MTGRAPSGQALAVPVEPVSRLAPSGFDPSRELVLKIAAYDDAMSKLGKHEVHARGILNFAKAEMLEVLKAIAMEARQGGDAKQGSVEDDSAAIAQNKSERGFHV